MSQEPMSQDERAAATMANVMESGIPEALKPFLREVALTLRILQNRYDGLAERVKRLEEDRASSPGWYLDEGE